jgi:genome maintenance exonuclease 1
MTFKHDFLNKTELSETYIDGRRHYALPGGVNVPSVTTVLSSLSEGHIDQWRNRIGHENADKITTQAKNRGTAIHALCEKYLLNDPQYTRGAMPVNVFNFTHLKTHLDSHIDHIRGIEYPLYSYKLKTAGRTDLIADWNKELAIIDFKTSLKIKKKEWIESYFLQATCYSLMLEELTGLKADKIVILISVDHESPQVFVEERSSWINKTLEVFMAPR